MAASSVTRFEPFPRSAIEQGITTRFAEQVTRYPQRLAVLTPEIEWTYAELDARSNAIAQAIIERAGEGSTPIALLFDQDAPQVAATLGILKTGRAYVPLDPLQPGVHAQEMFAFAEAQLLITDRAHFDQAIVIAAAPDRVFLLDEVPTDVPTPAVNAKVDSSTAAYIFFTSGSTGKPKGVVDSHRNVLHNIHRYSSALSITPDDRLTMIQSPTFSGTVSSLFCALLNGATLLPFDVRGQGFARLAEWVVRSRATIYHSVPSIFRGMVETGTRFPDVRVVRLEGDGATATDHALFCSAFTADALLAHGLGATETGLSCQLRMTRDTRWEGERLPIGHALPDMDVRIVDEAGAVLPMGSIGEIEARSEFLATGYWRDEPLTAQRFVRDVSDPAKRRYRTGDLGVQRAEGYLYHLGRKDLEHKINGQWVAIGDVENALRNIGSFGDVLAMTRKDDDGDPRLVAYVVMKKDAKADPAGWRKALAMTLPDHMIPSAFVALASFPVSEHGKVDRKALPSPAPSAPSAEAALPATHLEKSVAMIWQQVLGRERITLDDDFFALGGSSLSGLRALARMHDLTGVELPLSFLFQFPTLRASIAHLQENAQGLRWKNLAVIRSTGTRAAVILVHGDQANYHLPRLLPPEHPFLAFFHQGEDGMAMEHTTIPAMAAHYVEELVQARPNGPLVLAGYSSGGIVAFEMAHLLKARGWKIPLVVIIDSQGPGSRPRPTLKSALLSVRDAWDRWNCQRYLRSGTPIPEGKRTFYIMDMYNKAARTYTGRIWDGPVLLIRSNAEAHATMGWEGYCSDLHSAVVPGDHLSIIGARDVVNVARAFAEALEKYTA